MGNSSRKHNAANSKNTGDKNDSSTTGGEVTDVKECPNKSRDEEKALSHEEISLCLDKNDLSKIDNEGNDSTIQRTRSTESMKETNNHKKIKLKIKKEWLDILQEIELAKQLIDTCPGVHAKLDVDNCELHLEGPRDQFDDSRKIYDQIISEIYKEIFELPSSIIANIIESDLGKKYYRESLAKEKLTAQFFVENGCEINIVAVNSDHCMKAKDLLLDSFRRENISLSSEDLHFVESGECNEIFKKFKDNQLVEICIKKSAEKEIVLYGLTEIVVEAKKEIEDFMEKELVRSERVGIREDMADLLNGHLSYKVKEIEERLAESNVSIAIYQASETVLMKGNREGIIKCKELFSEICATIVEKSKEFSSPGLAKFLSGENGHSRITTIGMDHRAFIKNKYPVRKCEFTKTMARDSGVDTKGTKQGNEIYDLCSFTSKEGINVSWKYGNIEQEKAGVIVNSAMSNLNSPTACGKALNTVGGHLFMEACKPLTKIAMGDIAVTTGGDLSCIKVLHAVCCDWDRGKGKAEKILRDLLKKILDKCVELGVSSVVLPTIGTGQHKFPENVFFQVLKEEIELFSASNCHQHKLRVVRVVIFDAKRTPASRESSSQPSQTNSDSDGAKSPISEKPRVVNFGQVLVSLHEGDITQRLSSVDAIVNVLPSNLQLSNGGGVCNSILKTGGESIQQQLNKFGKCPPGSVLETGPGSITNAKYIIHFVPTTTDVLGIRSALEKCFDEAKARLLKTISISAIGTAAFKFSTRSSAELILEAAKNFSNANYPLEVNVVVFQKSMIQDFETVMGEKRKAIPVSVAKPKSKLTSSSAPLKSLNTEQLDETVAVHVLAASQQDADESLQEVDAFIKKNMEVKTIEHEKTHEALEKKWSTVEKLAKEHDVTIHCHSPSAVVIRGMKTTVLECKERLLQLITSYAEKERETNQSNFISKNFQWYYFKGGQSVAYSKEVNVSIEMAHMENKMVVRINQNDDQCEINLTAKTEKNLRTGQVETITRKHVADKNAEISLPEHWAPQSPGQIVHLVSLEASSQEYQRVLSHFNMRRRACEEIIKIERVQNPGLYKAFLVKKQSMDGGENEKQLFHGTKSDSIVPINANNFNRGYAGINGTRFGNGVYFARDASYSMRYSRADSDGYCYMYVARVLVGKFTAGKKGLKAPPSRNDPSNPGLLYDSVVNDVDRPSVFVIFLDHQCYPEYLITFKTLTK